MGVDFIGNSLQEFCEWASKNRKLFYKIMKLIEDIKRNGHKGEGKPEALSGNYAGWWSRRIDDKNRLVYRILDNGNIEIRLCSGHYNDK